MSDRELVHETRLGAGEVERRVAEVAHDIPPGRVMSYGDIAAVIGTGARQVGRAMATSEGALPWWRVTRADGTLPDDLRAVAAQHYSVEDTPTRGDGTRVDMRRARWNPFESD